MPSTERSTFSLKELAVRILLPLLIGGAIGYAVAYFMSKGGEDDRPPIIVSNGSIEIQEVDSANDSTTTPGKGTFKSGNPVNGRKIWTHEHSADKPKRLHVLVEGADSALTANCPAMYFAQNITAATITYSVDGGSRDVIVSKPTGNESVEINVRQDATVDDSSGYTLTVDEDINAKLVSVDVAWQKGNVQTTVTCQFGATEAPRLVFLQTTK